MKNLIPLLVVMIVSAGCASIVDGGSQMVSVQSQPDGATVTIDGKEMGTTPFSSRLKRKDGQILLLKKEGYRTYQTHLSTKRNNWIWGNIIFGGFFGCTTDSATGAIIEYSPDQYLATLQKDDVGAMPIQSDKKFKTKEFVVMGYRNIQSDLAKGQGEYLSSLYNLLEIKEEKQKEALEQLKALSALYKDIPTFADRLTDHFLAGKQTTSTETK